MKTVRKQVPNRENFVHSCTKTEEKGLCEFPLLEIAGLRGRSL